MSGAKTITPSGPPTSAVAPPCITKGHGGTPSDVDSIELPVRKEKRSTSCRATKRILGTFGSFEYVGIVGVERPDVETDRAIGANRRECYLPSVRRENGRTGTPVVQMEIRSFRRRNFRAHDAFLSPHTVAYQFPQPNAEEKQSQRYYPRQRLT